MPATTTNDLKTGMTLDLQDGLFQVVNFQHVKPGKGNAFVRTTLKNVKTGAVLDRTFRAGERVEKAILNKREMQYLYRESSNLVFMDQENYEQIEVAENLIADAVPYLVEGAGVVLGIYEGAVVLVELPASVTLKIADTEPGLKGDRVSGGTKPAVLETGLTVQVPLFISNGEEIKIDTRTGEYMSRQ